MADAGIDVEQVLHSPWPAEATLPWDHIGTRRGRGYFKRRPGQGGGATEIAKRRVAGKTGLLSPRERARLCRKTHSLGRIPARSAGKDHWRRVSLARVSGWYAVFGQSLG